ncbi:protein FAM221B isoform X2 [Dasypus novemcinctus]|uniref:protein FAM221B isoform X2 n=1 Tax=Dasypus novemcinctus TaxID=9361 RepID=UPI00265F1F06|nr:protein FAM221B isoform X2 [Dasypus novemcinctus]
MEADEVTEEPYTTMDAEEHPSSKDPSAEDLKEHPVSKTSSEPSTSEMPLEPFTAKSLFVPSPSQTPLETHTSESPLEPPISETALEPPTSESPLVPSASEIPLEAPTSQSSVEPLVSETPLEHTISDTFLKLPVPEAPVGSHISKAPEKHLTIHSAADYISVSCPDALREDLYPSQSSTSDVPQARRSILKDSEYEIVQTHSFSGLSARVHMDTSSNQREEAEEFEEEVNATDSTSHRSQPGQHLGKKKGKKAVSHYTVHPVVPAKQAELVAVAKTMHREKFSPRVNHLFQWEKDATLNAIQTGLYIGWRCPHYLWDCFRIGDESKCFCGHLLREHHIISDISVPCSVGQCRCLLFCFIPSRPEEVGEFWLNRRATFDPKAWRAQCRCKHSHEDHTATGSHPCRHHGCCCSCFESNFLCVACDRRWEEHETFFETEETRRRGGRPYAVLGAPAVLETPQRTTTSGS